MEILNWIILSIVEGVTEFLPVSSTGHMILAADILGIPESEFLKSFEVIIQSGAILAVVSLYFKVMLTKRVILVKLLVAFIPTGIVGLVFYGFIKNSLLGNTEVVLWSLFIGGMFLIFWERYYQKKQIPPAPFNKGGVRRTGDLVVGKIEDISYKKAFMIGIFQSVAVIPGVSRAAATIVGGMTAGLDRRAAVEFSFLLAVPTMAAATGLDLVKSNFAFSGNEWGILIFGFVGAFITAMFSMRYFLRFVEHHTFIPFGIYRIALALLFWVLIIY